jgi:drug/metabolite transporter (DMT)-like permease
VSEAPLPVESARPRRPRVGYAMAATAALLWGVNGAVSKVILASDVPSDRLAQVRSAGAALGLLAVLAVSAPQRLRVRRRELAWLAVFGIAGLAFVQWFYFLAIHRLAIGVALLLEYLAPLLVALWARFAYGEHVRRRVWAALALALAGVLLIVDVHGGMPVSTAGVAFGLLAAVAYALYVLMAERVIAGRDAVSLLFFGFAFASVFWAVLVPWWSFPAGRAAAHVSLLGHLQAHRLPVWALMSWMVVLGTIVPFFLLVSALRHLSATRVAIVAMLEPVTAALVARVWLGEHLAGLQLVGAAVVLAAIGLSQTAREEQTPA